MKSFACFFFFAIFHASEKLENELENLKLNLIGYENEFVIAGRFLEEQPENYRTIYIENISTREAVVEEIARSTNVTGKIFSNQDLLRIILCQLSCAEHLILSKTCKCLQNAMLSLYKQSIRYYPSRPKLYSFDEILCLSAIDLRFQKAFVGEIAQGPAVFTKIHDVVKTSVQKIPNGDEFVPRLKLSFEYENYWNILTSVDCDDLPAHEEYKQLAKKGAKILYSALKQTYVYNLTRQKAKVLLKSRIGTDQDVFITGLVSVMFTLYIIFLILPFSWKASKFIHLMISIFSFVHHLSSLMTTICCNYSLVPHSERIYAQIPINIVKGIHLFGAVAGLFNMSIALNPGSFVKCILSAIFMGCSDYLPIFIVFVRALCIECVKSPEPVEIRKAKNTIKNTKRFFFVET